MKCLKCGRTIRQAKCPDCGFDYSRDSFLSVFSKKPSGQLSKPEDEGLLMAGLSAYEDRNYLKALDSFRDASAQGSSIAAFYLGRMYENGQGVDADINEAVSWYRNAAELKNSAAMTCLGNCYRYGRGVDKNAETARVWYEKAAEMNDYHAQFHLGELWEEGIGTEKNENHSNHPFLNEIKN